MSCLLFMDTGKADRLKKANELTSIFKSVMEDGHLLVNAERATIWIYDKAAEELWSRVATGEDEEIRISASKGVAGYCARHGEIINIHDAYSDDRFNSDVCEREASNFTLYYHDRIHVRSSLMFLINYYLLKKR